MKILIIANYRESAGGISGQVKLLYEHLKREGEEVQIFSTRGKPLMRLLLFVKLFFVASRYDILHIHACSYWGFLPAVYGIIVGKLLQKHIVLTYHGGGGGEFFSAHPKLVRFFLTGTDTNIVLSGYLAEVFKQYNLPYVIIPNILEEKANNEYEIRQIIRSNFISIRSLEPLYNVECILKAFEIVKAEISNAKLIVLGDGSCRTALENYVKGHQIENVEFYGHVNNSDIDKYLSQADVFLSAPTIDNQPMSVLEAFRAGLLVISSRVGGVPYMIEHGVTGLMFESNNYQELASLMIFAVKNQTSSLSMIQRAQEQLKIYSWPNIRQLLYSCYGIW